MQRFPVETLKIDRAFVDEFDHRPENRAIVGLGESLGLTTIAEGVERTAETVQLQALGCHMAQGYLYGRPLPAAALGPFPTDDLHSWQELLAPAAP